MGSTASTLSHEILSDLVSNMTSETKDALLVTIQRRCEKVLSSYPNNRCCKFAAEFLSTEKAKHMSNDEAKLFFKCICTGIENPDSSLGCYAMTSSDYSKTGVMGSFFQNIVRDYHVGDTSIEKEHVTDWSINGANYDVKKLGYEEELSMRVRVGRNLNGFRLPGAMDKEERIKFERRMLPAFDQIIKKYGGAVYSLTPNFGEEMNPNLISKDKYRELIDAHVMFKDMSADPYLKSAGISNDWPFGRGCWQSVDKTRIIWFGEEDHLRIMCMRKGSDLNEVFTDLKDVLDAVESIEGLAFARDDIYGFVTSCPSNLGTGMRASVHLKLPNMTMDGTDTKLREVCRPLGLSVRGIGGEHTPIGKDGTVDISPSSRLFIKENEIISKLYDGVKQLTVIEKNLKDSRKNEHTSSEGIKPVNSKEDATHLQGKVEKKTDILPIANTDIESDTKNENLTECEKNGNESVHEFGVTKVNDTEIVSTNDVVVKDSTNDFVAINNTSVAPRENVDGIAEINKKSSGEGKEISQISSENLMLECEKNRNEPMQELGVTKGNSTIEEESTNDIVAKNSTNVAIAPTVNVDGPAEVNKESKEISQISSENQKSVSGNDSTESLLNTTMEGEITSPPAPSDENLVSNETSK